MDADPVDERRGPYLARTSTGLCHVLNYSPDHAQRMATMDVSAIESVVHAWAALYRDLGALDAIKYPLIFENRGEIMGNSQPHPHGQIYAYDEIPGLLVRP